MVRNALPRRFGAPGLPELNASQVCRYFIFYFILHMSYNFFPNILILCRPFPTIVLDKSAAF
jgi:hypothetical protein